MIDTEELLILISQYMDKHPLAKECGEEYVHQDAINFVVDIFENCF